MGTNFYFMDSNGAEVEHIGKRSSAGESVTVFTWYILPGVYERCIREDAFHIEDEYGGRHSLEEFYIIIRECLEQRYPRKQ